MKILLLPGMDGTGLLFEPLIKKLPKNLDLKIISLNEIEESGYLDQAHQVSRVIGESKVILVAESYSGRIAYELCCLLGEQVAKVIFLASFVSRPCKISRVAAVLPSFLLRPSLIPDLVFKRLCFSGYGGSEEYSLVRKAIGSVKPAVLKRRLVNMGRLEHPKLVKNTPAVYIQPTKDHLVSGEALNSLREVYPRIKIEVVEGGHFIAQTNPDACARVLLSATST